MYAFRQRADTRVVDEPLYAHYLHVTGADHPGRADILAAMDHEGQRVYENVILGPRDRPVLFVKNMGHHFVELPWALLTQTSNVLLIRDPEQMLPSLINQVPNPTLADTALLRQREIYDFLDEHDQVPCVLDSRHLLLDPAGVLRRLCEHLGMDFDKGMTRWPAGPKPEEGPWAPHWYHVIHQSTGFQPYRAKTAPFPAFLRPLLAECRPIYEHLYQFALVT